MISERNVLEKINRIRGVSEITLKELFRESIKVHLKKLLLKGEIQFEEYAGLVITKKGLQRLSACEGCECDPCDCDWGIL